MGEISDIQKVIAGIYKNVYHKKTNWPCAICGCANSAIVSHLLQQNGILSELSEDRHFYMVKNTDMYGWGEKNSRPFEFKRVGIHDAMSLYLFCKEHDDMLFSEFEKQKGSLDVYNYHHKLLFCMRSLYAEKRLKEYGIEVDKRQKEAKTLPSNFCKQAEELMHLSEIGISEIEQYIKIINDCLKGNSEQVKFLVREFDYFPVSISTSFSLSTEDEALNFNILQPCVLFHFFPYNSKSYLILGYFEDYINDPIKKLLDEWKQTTWETLGLSLTRIILNPVDMWAMAPSVYKLLKPENIERFHQILEERMYEITPSKIDFNLFDGIEDYEWK